MEVRFSRDWRPSQWKEYNPFANEFRGCRSCHDSAHTQERTCSSQHLAQETLQHLATLVPNAKGRACMSRWILKWESGLPATTRKLLSHYGAVKCRTAAEGVSWEGADGRKYFDATNDIYARVIWLLCDAELVGHRCNESCGDFCERWLGLGFLREHERDDRSIQMCQLATWIEDVTYLVYVLMIRCHVRNDLPPRLWAETLRHRLV